MGKRIQMTLTVIAPLCSLSVTRALAQTNGTNSSNKMSSQQMMDKLIHLSTTEKAAMFDRMTKNDRTAAMKMEGHNMSKMSDQERMDMMKNLRPEERAEMFDKMPMDTRMATMTMVMREQRKRN